MNKLPNVLVVHLKRFYLNYETFKTKKINSKFEFPKKLNLKQRLSIYEIIEPNFIEIATNKSGTHSIQSLIECINSPVEIVILDKLLSKIENEWNTEYKYIFHGEWQEVEK